MVLGFFAEETQLLFKKLSVSFDTDWFDPDDKASALMDLLEDIQKVCQWLMTQTEPLVQNDEIIQIYTKITQNHIFLT